ncbi:extracellular solute-binding protein [Pseudoflavonifractor phocaeensis]|uniref:ABC transporter substrate-binding protein n=1 Tax=Pseudoflavonifractor phocaeensis TaxID=1870988 RepID=UPI003090D94C|nr:sugar ABC transporter substrate-binding protein [Oscillospiraceae bacterium]
MNMRKTSALLLALSMTFGLAACGGGTTTSEPPAESKAAETDNGGAAAGATEITLWTYPIGNWGKEEAVKTLTDAFKEDTGITVKVEYLAYADGDDKVNSAITAKSAPDLVMEGPERLVANWGASGYMVDLSDMLTDTDRSEIQASVLDACTAADGSVYEYPLVMTAHCMAVNLNAFKEAGADQYLDLETHTWTTENFIKAVQALYDHYGETVGAVYCAGQGGDQGTRALVNNLYGGTFTDAEHTKYTWDDPLNVKALEQLKSMDGIAFDASLAGGDEITKFYQGVLKMAFCWNIAQQLNPNSADTGAEKTVTGDDIVFMSFPSETGESKLQGGIWGFGIFDNGDPAKIDAAKTFIEYMANSEHTVDAVKTANYFPVRSTAGGVDLTTMWADEPIMDQYQVLMPQLGDYYQVTKGWAQARTSWWNMLQKVGEGADIATTVASYAEEANAAAK